MEQTLPQECATERRAVERVRIPRELTPPDRGAIDRAMLRRRIESCQLKVPSRGAVPGPEARLRSSHAVSSTSTGQCLRRRRGHAEQRSDRGAEASLALEPPDHRRGRALGRVRPADRKSTRLNSSHLVISYAVFCLKKKKTLA